MSRVTRRCEPDRRPVLRVVVALLVVVVVVGAGGCQVVGRPDAEGRVSSSETPPTATASAPASVSASLSAEEQALRDAALSTPKPERPAGMDEFTVEGAAFAGEYFLLLYPYVYATGDLEPWQAMSDPGCVFCNNVMAKVTDMHSTGGWLDPWPQEAVAEHYGMSDEDPNLLAMSFRFSHPESVDHDGLGGTRTAKGEDIILVLQMRWTGQAWVIEEGQVQ